MPDIVYKLTFNLTEIIKMSEKTLTEKVAEVMSGIWVDPQKQEEALRKVLSENDKEAALVDAIAVGVKKAMEPEVELSYEEQQQAMLNQMYPEMSKPKEIRVWDFKKSVSANLYSNSPGMIRKEVE